MANNTSASTPDIYHSDLSSSKRPDQERNLTQKSFFQGKSKSIFLENQSNSPPGNTWDPVECDVDYKLPKVLLSNNLNLLALICHSNIVGDLASTFSNNILTLLSDHLDELQVESFIKRLIKTKVQFHSKKEIRNVFRDNSLATLLLIAFVRKHCQTYLTELLTEPIKDILGYIESCEIDSTKVGDAELLHQNLERVEKATYSIIESVVSQQDKMPDLMRRLCYNFTVLVMLKESTSENRSIISLYDNDEESKRSSYASDISISEDNPLSKGEMVIGTFFFLRFIIPAVTAPDAYKIVGSGVTITSGMRRGLVLCGKILTTLCNGLYFGAKETYMCVMNPFLDKLRPTLKSFLDFMSLPVEDPCPAYVTFTNPTHSEGVLDNSPNASIGKISAACAKHSRYYDLCQVIRNNLPRIEQHIGQRITVLSPLETIGVLDSFLEMKSILLQEENNPTPQPKKVQTFRERLSKLGMLK